MYLPDFNIGDLGSTSPIDHGDTVVGVGLYYKHPIGNPDIFFSNLLPVRSSEPDGDLSESVVRSGLP